MLFPKTIATGDAFCNRDEERKLLRNNIENIQHSLVISPRRYGKTSLIFRVIEEIGWPYAHVDLFLAFEELKITERFLDGIAKLVSQIIPINIKAIAKIRDFFKLFSISINVGDVSFGLKLESTQSSQVTVKNAIEGLENLLKKYKKRAIFFIDEMQDIVQTTMCSEIEATIRFYAQQTKNLAFIFSGSNRKLLKEIFDDRSRPLFKMCDRLNLKRINATHYQEFLNRASLKQWRNKLPKDSLDLIFELTELHPYYINYLCARLWQLSELPNVDQIKNSWNQICEDETNNLAMDIDALSFNQKKLLEYIAQRGVLISPTAQEHLQKLQITSRGLLQALKGLTERDLIEKTTKGFMVLDPLLKSILIK